MTPFSPAVSGVGFDRIVNLIPDCQSEVLSECGHYLVIEQPQAVAALIADFLRDIAPN